jgi:murein DD-endopeptidase MepM/ murein hydrolase activator NlpD
MGWRGAYGNLVVLDHGGNYYTYYAHLSQFAENLVVGLKLLRGEELGLVGSTGRSTGPHLHLSVYAKDAVELKTVPSKSCPGRVLTQPISPINAYLDPLYYLPSTTAGMFK